MVKLVRVKAKGFGSIVEKVKYKFDRPGLNIITGPNGVGKSTLFQLVTYNWFGQTLKVGSSIGTWEHLSDGKGTWTESEVHKDGKIYRIVRCNEYTGKIDGKRGKNQLLVYEDGKLLQLKGKVDTQRFINTLVGYSYNLFKAAVVFGQETKRLMEEDGPAKKKILEEAFEASYISKAKEVVEKRLGIRLKEEVQANHFRKIKLSTLKASKKLYEQQKTLQESFESDKDRKIKALKKEINGLKKEKAKKEERIKKLGNIEKRLAIVTQKALDYKPDTSLEDREFRLSMHTQAALDKVEQKVSLIGQIKKSTYEASTKPCDKCGQKMDLKARGKFLLKAKEELSNHRKELTQLQEEYREKNKEWQEVKSSLSSLERDKKTYQNILMEKRKLEDTLETIKDARRDILHIDKDIKKIRLQIKEIRKEALEIDLPALEHKIKRCRRSFREATTAWRKIKSEVSLDEWLLKDPLSNSGLKTYIFNTMLQKLNRHLMKYYGYIGFGLSVGMDMESARKDVEIVITSKGMIGIPYQDLSKGQKQLANMALIFAIHDTVTESKPINILILDEIFESLHRDNVEKIGSMIQAKAKNKSIHLITHLTDFNPVNAYRVNIQLNEKGHTVVYSKLKDS